MICFAQKYGKQSNFDEFWNVLNLSDRFFVSKDKECFDMG